MEYQDVENYMHLPYFYRPMQKKTNISDNKVKISDSELQRVWNNTYRTNKQMLNKKSERVIDEAQDIKLSKPKCILVDGYNVIFGFDELKRLADDNLDLAKSRLLNMLGEYQAYRCDLLIVVFDAYKLDNTSSKAYEDHNIFVVYTKNKETADTYIEKAVGKLNKEYMVTVITSDNLEQMTIMQQNAHRMSVREFKKDYQLLKRMVKERLQKEKAVSYNHSLKDIMKYFEEN